MIVEEYRDFSRILKFWRIFEDFFAPKLISIDPSFLSAIYKKLKIINLYFLKNFV
jgi:hypothetical protein